MATDLTKPIERRTPPSASFPKGLTIRLEPPNIVVVRDRRHRHPYQTTVEAILWNAAVLEAKQP